MTKWIFQKSGASTTNWSSIFLASGISWHFPRNNSSRLEKISTAVFSNLRSFRRQPGSGDGWGVFLVPKNSPLCQIRRLRSFPCRYELFWICFLDLLMKRQFSPPQYCLSKKKIQCSLNQLMVLLVLLLKQVFRSSVFQLQICCVSCLLAPHSPACSTKIFKLSYFQLPSKITPPKCSSLLLMEEIPNNHLECNNTL